MTAPPTSQHDPDPGDAGEPNAREQRIAGAVAEFLDLQAAGKDEDPESFCGRHPDLLPELEVGIRTLLEMDGMLEPPKSEEPATLEPLPERLSGCRILGLIGSGGMGRVLLACDEGLGRKVAIKTLNSRYLNNTVLRSRFMQEARSLASLSHPNIVRIYNLGPSEEPPHFVMEYVTGVPLSEGSGALSLRQKAELMLKILLAVEFLHRHQIIHRDLKPGNILVGPDLEPKLLDFGLALQVDDPATRLTLAGEVMGTPDYFSPEQARAEGALDTRSDVFSLGAILYELITGSLPFRADSLMDQIRQICDGEPELPRRINGEIPVDLQNICLKAMEKNPADRYGTAGDMARDLERFLAGESVLANPASYGRIMSGRISHHVRDLDGWRRDGILSWYEFDAFRKLYDHLADREDAWILEVRRLSTSQVTLYLGAWTLVVAALLVLLFRHSGLSGTAAVALVSGATIPMAWIGLRCWRQEQKRLAIAFLLAFCLLLPTAMLVAMKEWNWLAHFSQGKESLELFAKFDMFRSEVTRVERGPGGVETVRSSEVFRGTTNAQLWWAICLSLPAYFWLRRFTKASVFSLVFAVMGAQLGIVTLLRMGMLEWLEKDPGRIYFRLIPMALIFFVAAAIIEYRRNPNDSRYFYPIAVLFTFVALSGVAAFHEPYARWLESTLPKTRGQIEYLFIINAAIYLTLQSISERYGSPQLRTVAKSFRFVIPGHVLTSLLLLGLAASHRWEEAVDRIDLRREARFFEILLPAAACLFVFGSVPKQMKNFFVTGLVFLAVGLGRLQQDLFKERPVWPVSLLATGLILMLIAANFTPIRLAISRLLRKFRTKSS